MFEVCNTLELELRKNLPCLVPPNPADTDKVCAVAVAGTVKAKAKVCKVEMYFMVSFVVSLLLLLLL